MAGAPIRRESTEYVERYIGTQVLEIGLHSLCLELLSVNRDSPKGTQQKCQPLLFDTKHHSTVDGSSDLAVHKFGDILDLPQTCQNAQTRRWMLAPEWGEVVVGRVAEKHPGLGSN